MDTLISILVGFILGTLAIGVVGQCILFWVSLVVNIIDSWKHR